MSLGKRKSFSIAILKFIANKNGFIPQSTYYLGLTQNLITQDNTPIEVSGGGYVRQPVSFDVGTNDDFMHNDIDVVFPAPSSAYQVSGYGVFFDQVGGEMMWYGNFAQPQTIDKQIVVPSGSLTIREF